MRRLSPAKAKTAAKAKNAAKSKTGASTDSRSTIGKAQSAAAQAVDRQLKRYRSMRNFDVSAEPRGHRTSNPDSNALPFVVQKHAATRLHYDFRLGWRGVLKSWAVTKGPSFNSADKRLAVQVEDHPIEYGGFEGTIPKGQYGGGTVMLWDFGDWTPHGDVDEGLLKGHLKFELHGNKLKGSWALIRMHGQAERADKPHWLLIKENDSFTRPSSEPAIIDEAPESALTHRTMDEIAAGNDHSWGSATKAAPTASLAHFTLRPTADHASPLD